MFNVNVWHIEAQDWVHGAKLSTLEEAHKFARLVEASGPYTTLINETVPMDCADHAFALWSEGQS